MNATAVTIALNNIRCFDEGDGIGSAEPYLWTVFFKIDGNTAHILPSTSLAGSATVVSTPGNHGDLGPAASDVDPGDNVAIPAALALNSSPVISEPR